MWKVEALNLGKQYVRKSAVMEGFEPDETIAVPFVGWLLTHQETNEKYLVDCGPDQNNAEHIEYHNPLERETDQHILAQLKKKGVDPTELKAIIATHLHWDHMQAITELPESLEIIVQREELAYAAASKGSKPGVPFETNFPELGIPYFLRCYHQYHLIDGDYEVEPGIQLVLVPGHTPGCQAVIVDTEKGRIAITGDLVNLQENWDEKWIPGINHDKEACIRSYQRMEELEKEGVIIVPSHDFCVFETF